MTSIFSFFFFTLAAVTQMQIPVPFTPQAPEGIWVEPWANACEEASIVMVDAYYRGLPLDTTTAVDRIHDVIAEKEKRFGESKDESAETIVSLIEDTALWHARIEKKPTVEEIQRELHSNRPVIIPFDARRVSNPHFIDPKPDYHVAVIIGFDEETKTFIVHEPGTSFGESFRYGYDELLAANESYEIGDTGEERGGDVIFTSPETTVEKVVRRIGEQIRKVFTHS
ncbi:MAG TPA: C39 family peptidase [Candidatus Kapabacteria bacterium]|nr:C39 family peptidase [Candidatus Kapabacteria bacterium]